MLKSFSAELEPIWNQFGSLLLEWRPPLSPEGLRLDLPWHASLRLNGLTQA